MKKTALLLLGFLLVVSARGEESTPPSVMDPLIIVNNLKHIWPAQWIAHPSAPSSEYGVFHFRKRFILAKKPDHFIVHVSADNRYRLFVNGHPVSDGPAKGDKAHWRYESVDIAEQLQAGENVLAAIVWNFGELLPWNQISRRTAFILQGDGQLETPVNTGDDWKVTQDKAFSPIPSEGTMVAPCDRIEGKQYPWGWQETAFDDAKWEKARTLGRGFPYGTGADMNWALVPRPIPPMESSVKRIGLIRRVSGVPMDEGFLNGSSALKIPAHTKAVLLLDQAYLTTAYPELTVSGGKGSEIKMTYAEALFDAEHHKKNRNDVEGMHIEGIHDLFLPDGGTNRLFRTLWFRTYRYIEMEIKTGATPLILNDFHGQYTGYPFEAKASFTSSDPSLDDIWKVGWRTARLCAAETYYDCPYYEQMQYVGDTRIQALISLYVTGDDRLMRNAIQQFDESRNVEGLTQSRYPTSFPQIIPPFSLFWIGMVHDYWMHRDDPAFVGSFMEGVRSVLAYHEKHLDDSGMLGVIPWWNFVDWTEQWPWLDERNVGGIAPGEEKGRSSILTLQYVMALQSAADLARAFGRESEALHYDVLATQAKRATRQLCWDESRGFLADNPEKKSFSQHANLLAVLTGLIPSDEQKAFMEKVVYDKQLIQCTYYYRFYLYRAMKKAGLGERYVEMLEPWRDALKLGFTTFPERPGETRSDCHAWSASPNYDLLASVCGIEPASPGFKTVKIEPRLGWLKWVEGKMPHPLGEIAVHFDRIGESGLKGTVTLPVGLSGTLVWNGKTIPLKSGQQNVEVEGR